MRRTKTVLLVAGGATIVFSLVVARWIVGVGSDIAATDVSDLIPQPLHVSEEDNAFVHFRKAATLIDWPSEDYAVYKMIRRDAWDAARAADLISRNAEALVLLKNGLSSPAYQAYRPSESEGADLHMLWSRGAGELLALRAAQEWQVDRPGEAWQASFDLLHFGSMIAMHPRGMIEYLIALSTIDLCLSQISRWLSASRLSEAELASLSRQLDHIGPLDEGMIAAVRMEFQFINESIDEMASASQGSGLMRCYVFHPNRTRDFCARTYRAMIADASRPYAMADLPKTWTHSTKGGHGRLLFLKPNYQGRMLAAMCLISPDRIPICLASKCRTQGGIECLRLVVACLQYETRHGHLPDTLETLVPELLPQVPRDPADGKPFRYLREAGKVYSVGLDLKDSQVGNDAESGMSSAGRRQQADDLVYTIHPRAEQ